MTTPVTSQRADDRLVGIWLMDEGFQTVELLFRSDARYELTTTSTDPDFPDSATERGRYATDGTALTLSPYDYFGQPADKRYEFASSGASLTLTRVEFSITEVYGFKAGSRADVLARQHVDPGLVGAWRRRITFWGEVEYTFRPGNYFILKDSPEAAGIEPTFTRGRYEQNSGRLFVKPYSGIEASYEIDFFGNTLTLIKVDESWGESASFEAVPGSPVEVRAKSEEADAFLARENWHVGVWEVRDPSTVVDLTLRPDGYYISKDDTADFLRGIVRGRFTLEPRRIRLMPFIGQDLYARSNGEFGKVERTRELDYYDGELQFIDLEALSQSVTIARRRAGTETLVMDKTREARATREHHGWHIGIWEVNDPAGWMEFTFRPDERYIAKSGADRMPVQVERGQYLVGKDKVTLSAYAGLSQGARGFELDLYDGDLFLIGDSHRLVVARKVADSEKEVGEKTRTPSAMKGECGSILGLWSANLTGESVALVFRHDEEFRLSRCANDTISNDYGLYKVDMATRTLVSDSRFVQVQKLGLDFYDDTMTMYGGILGPPTTYTVNLGIAEASMKASLDADVEKEKIDTEWLARVPIAPRRPDAVQMPIGDIPPDPLPGKVFDDPTVFAVGRLYRWLIAGFVYFMELGTIKSVPVVNTREWYFFPTGRALIRFKNYRAGAFYPSTVADVSNSWGAYRIDAKPGERDILHRYADNNVFITTDLGEQMAMTLEDGRRNLFWNKDYQILSEWASERKPVPCQASAKPDLRLMNNGISLSTGIPPDPIRDPQ